MFVSRFMTGLKKTCLPAGREKRARAKVRSMDMVTEQVRKMLQTADQKLILMVRG